MLIIIGGDTEKENITNKILRATNKKGYKKKWTGWKHLSSLKERIYNFAFSIIKDVSKYCDEIKG